MKKTTLNSKTLLLIALVGCGGQAVRPLDSTVSEAQAHDQGVLNLVQLGLQTVELPPQATDTEALLGTFRCKQFPCILSPELSQVHIVISGDELDNVNQFLRTIRTTGTDNFGSIEVYKDDVSFSLISHWLNLFRRNCVVSQTKFSHTGVEKRLSCTIVDPSDNPKIPEEAKFRWSPVLHRLYKGEYELRYQPPESGNYYNRPHGRSLGPDLYGAASQHGVTVTLDSNLTAVSLSPMVATGVDNTGLVTGVDSITLEPAEMIPGHSINAEQLIDQLATLVPLHAHDDYIASPTAVEYLEKDFFPDGFEN